MFEVLSKISFRSSGRLLKSEILTFCGILTQDNSQKARLVEDKWSSAAYTVNNSEFVALFSIFSLYM
jgi:hypothetical protein